MTDTAPRSRRAESERGVAEGVVVWLVKGIQWLLLAGVFAILLEWIGMTWWWPGEGVQHSQRMLAEEQSYLTDEIPRHLFSPEPVRFAIQLGRRLSQGIFGLTRLHEVIAWATTPPATGEARLRVAIRKFVKSLTRYLLTAEQTLQIFGTRLAIMILAIPVLGLGSLVAVVDGLVRRDLRRWGGGRESGFIYHWAKQVAMPFALGIWLIYLMIPVTIPPSLVILPFATLLGFAITVTAATFKKYF